MLKCYSNYTALVVGVSHYLNPLYDLDYARSDAEALAKVLKDEYGFALAGELYDEKATKDNILKYLEHEMQKVDSESGVVLFFACHGITKQSPLGEDEGFLVPYDGDVNIPYKNIPILRLREEYLKMIPAKHVFMIVDACYSGLALRDIPGTRIQQCVDDEMAKDLTKNEKKVRQALSAGTKDQKVLDGGLYGHSIFTGRLIEVLRQNELQYLTADHVGLYVREHVSRDAVERHSRQTPQFGYLYGADGTFVFQRDITKPSVIMLDKPKSQSAKTEEYLCHILYDGNGHTAGEVPKDSKTYRPTQMIRIASPASDFAKEGFQFSGWNTKPDGTGMEVAPGSEISMPLDGINLYAKWKKAKHEEEQKYCIVCGAKWVHGFKFCPACGAKKI